MIQAVRPSDDGTPPAGRPPDLGGPVVDAAALEALARRLGARAPEFLEQLYATWDAETTQRFAELTDAIAAADTAGVRRAAHALKGSSASLGAVRLATVSGELEVALQVGRPVDLAEVGPRLAAEIDAARAVLRARCAP